MDDGNTVVSELLALITHCTHSHDYSIRIVEPHVSSNDIYHVRLRLSKTEITYVHT